MAGTLSGITPTTTERRRRIHLVPSTTRTRRCHGVFIAGGDLAIVYSARRESTACPVLLELGHGDEQQLSCRMTAAQARGVARALSAAAGAVDARQAATALPARLNEGSAAVPQALPGLWSEEGGLDGLVRLDTPATTPGMVVVAKAAEDWQHRPHLRWQTWPDLLAPATDAKGGVL